MKDISPGQSEIKLLKTSDKEKVWQTGSTQPPRLLHEETLDASPQARAKAGRSTLVTPIRHRLEARLVQGDKYK